MISQKMFSNNTKLSQQAAKWFIRMQEAPLESAERIKFESWLMQNPQHQQEYASISQAWDGFDSMEELKATSQCKAN